MRILKIRFKNLNSLAGEWSIDLTDPAYTTNGIFAITGPTGSGKTTILDAVCLALYGRTPRLDRVTKSGNEIMSRQTGECFAEVTFETLAGRYRCHWSQRRARGKPGGELQQPRQEIANDETGILLDSSIRGVAGQIETVTGMDFDRFTRSMLLAQGGFAAFLQAGPDARAPILEQITGTEIYSRISTQVHLLRAEVRIRLEQLEAEQSGLHMLSEEEEGSLRTQMAACTQDEARAVDNRQALAAAIAWREQLDRLEGALRELGLESEALRMRQEAFVPHRDRLAWAMRALVLDGDAKILASLRQDQANDKKENEGAFRTLPLKESAVQQALKTLEESEAGRSSAKTALRDAQPVFRAVRELDMQAREKFSPIQKEQEAVALLERDSAGLHIQIDQDRTSFCQLQTEQKTLSQRISDTLADEALVEQLTGIMGRFETLRERDSQYAKKKDELTHAEKLRVLAMDAWSEQTLAYAEKKAILAQTSLAFDSKQAERNRIQAGRTSAEWRETLDHARERKALLEKVEASVSVQFSAHEALTRYSEDHLAMSSERSALDQSIREQAARSGALDQKIRMLQTQIALIRKIEAYDDARRQLEDGHPCPLCGASEHPYAVGNIPVPGDSLAELRITTDEFQQANAVLTDHRIRLAEIQKGIEQAVSRQAEAHTAIQSETVRIEQYLLVLAPEAIAADMDTLVPRLRAEIETDFAWTAERMAAVDRLDEETTALRDALEKDQAEATETRRKAQDEEHAKNNAEQSAERVQQELLALAHELRQMMENTLVQVRPFGVNTIQVQDLPIIERGLLSRRDLWIAGQKQKAEMDRQAASLEQMIHAREEKAAAAEIGLDEHRAALQRLAEERDELVRIRQERFGDRNPETEEVGLAESVEEAERQVETARQTLEAAAQDRDGHRHRLEALEAAIAARTLRLAGAEEAFSLRLTQAGFANETDFLSAQLPESERETLQLQARSLEADQSGWSARNQDTLGQLESERKRAVTKMPLEMLLESRGEADEEIRNLGQLIGGIRQRLQDQADLGQRRQALMRDIGVLRQECGRWDTLHELIGSADGKKYRNFAQGITFEMLVGHANQQLLRLTDRYLLVRDDCQPLELSVIDNDQAGEIRSTKNLSGGESFIVSLSLALGLSQMSSRKVRVDSLFLDEGFGTLDEETLETALETLASLHQDGKLIGVISHVQAIRERIGTRIQVVPRFGGKSALVGPGCYENVAANASGMGMRQK